MGSALSKSTNKFYDTLFDDSTALGKWNSWTDPAGKLVADDAIEKTTPQVEPTLPNITMPTSDDEAVKRARRKKIASAQSGSGRASTIYTDTGDARLGG